MPWKVLRHILIINRTVFIKQDLYIDYIKLKVIELMLGETVIYLFYN